MTLLFFFMPLLIISTDDAQEPCCCVRSDSHARPQYRKGNDRYAFKESRNSVPHREQLQYLHRRLSLPYSNQFDLSAISILLDILYQRPLGWFFNLDFNPETLLVFKNRTGANWVATRRKTLTFKPMRGSSLFLRLWTSQVPFKILNACPYVLCLGCYDSLPLTPHFSLSFSLYLSFHIISADRSPAYCLAFFKLKMNPHGLVFFWFSLQSSSIRGCFLQCLSTANTVLETSFLSPSLLPQKVIGLYSRKYQSLIAHAQAEQSRYRSANGRLLLSFTKNYFHFRSYKAKS